VRVEKPDGDIEDFTDTAATWSLAFRQWAEIVPFTGDEEIASRQINPRLSHRIRMRWAKGVDTTRIRFVHEGTTYHVASAKNIDSRNRVWEFACREEVD
jgi:head-tail adaptor